jgi:hypothetical protein
VNIEEEKDMRDPGGKIPNDWIKEPGWAGNAPETSGFCRDFSLVG